MDRQAFYAQMMNDIRARAEVDNDFTESAFLNEMTDRLVEAEVVNALTPVHFTGSGIKNRRLAVSAYEFDESDDSVALVVLDFEDSDEVGKLGKPDAEKQFLAVERFIEESLGGSFQQGREESTEEYQLAETLRRRAPALTRFRIYLLTNRALSGRVKDFPSGLLGQTPVEYHIWDVERFLRVFESSLGREDLEIDLTEWSPSGIRALRAEAPNGETDTFLLVLPARLVADLYGRYGSQLLEGNVRSYLSNRGKVNRGIRESILTNPDRFLAYNNGITATATAVEVKDSSITGVTNLQIVNGGQTTASLFYTLRDNKAAQQFEEAFVQAKLVVVSPDIAQELVPNISRFANSQNKVNEADFFSNSPFHVRLEELSRRVLTPPRPGVTFQSKWFYERVRGQYANEKTRLSSIAEEKKFEATYPKSQVVTKTDAAKYAVSWAKKPHLVSGGAQKNFVAFANEAGELWDTSNASINESYWKHLVGKAILYKTLRSEIAQQPWYESGYLANIVTYTIAKIADVIEVSGQGEFDFDAVWQRQALSESTVDFGIEVARQVLDVLVDDDRPVVNVTEWAKREQCWKMVQAVDLDLPRDLGEELVSMTEVRSSKRSARTQQRVDDGIHVQAEALAVTSEEWREIQRFAEQRRLLSPTDAGILALVTNPGRGIPSERQAAKLMELRKRVAAGGYDYDRR